MASPSATGTPSDTAGPRDSLPSRLYAIATANPARVAAITASVVVFLAAKLGIVIDQQNVGEALAIIVPILLAGESTRRKVIPVSKIAIPPHLHDEVAGRDEISAPLDGSGL